MPTSAHISALIFGCALFACSGSSSGLSTTLPHDLLGQRVRPQTQLTLNGGSVLLPPPGKTVVLDFWATWCAPCLKMMPELDAMAREYKERGVVVVGIAADDNPGLVVETIRKTGISFEQVMDDSAAIRGSYYVKDLPRTLVFDRTGKLRFVAREGDNAGRDVRAALDAVLAE